MLSVPLPSIPVNAPVALAAVLGSRTVEMLATLSLIIHGPRASRSAKVFPFRFRSVLPLQNTILRHVEALTVPIKKIPRHETLSRNNQAYAVMEACLALVLQTVKTVVVLRMFLCTFMVCLCFTCAGIVSRICI